VLPLSECVYLNPAKNQILTYDSKWLVDSPDYRNTEVFCPIKLDPDMAQELERIALLAFEVMECKDYARIDFRVNGRTPYLLDVNPNPSIHPDDAGFTRSWKATGRNYDQLVIEILTSSIENNAFHQKVKTYENTNTQN
jgi:D-alanine-D-alanine ligase